ncbi:MAG: FliA/WhiG family RNA polymerase sigma factor [Nitrospinota bacterium]
MSDERKSQLVVVYAPIIKQMAGRLAIRVPPSVEVDDLVQAGIIGLLEALERYDPRRYSHVKPYAEIRIRGAMLDYLRSLDWVPHSLRRRVKRLKELEGRLEAQKGRSLTREELAEATGERVEIIDKLREYTSNLVTLSLHGEMNDEVNTEWIAAIPDENAVDPVEVLHREDLVENLATVIAKLPDQERLVLSLYYYEGLTMKEISDVLDVTVSRISQIHSNALRSAQRKLSTLMEESAGM